MMTDSHRKIRQRNAGFTLIEMMVALVIGALVVASVFSLGGASARHFQEQQRVGVTQRSVRMAMNRVRRDVARAGFLSVPSDLAPNVGLCTNPAIPRRVAGVWLDNDDAVGNSALNRVNRAANAVSADRLRLTGNYATGDEYQIRSGPMAAANRIRLATQTQAFSRSFMVDVGAGIAPDINRFLNTFRIGRFLRIQAMTGEVTIVQITGSSWAGDNATITISPGIPDAMQCPSGPVDVGGSMVAPISEIEYFIDQPRGGSVLTPTAAQVVGPATYLIRRELNMQDGSEMPNSRRVVLEFAIDFNISFVRDANLTPGLAPDLRIVRGNAAQNASQGTPWQIRTAMISLAARTPDQDRRFPWTYGGARPAAAPLNRFLVMAGQPGAARVRQLTTEVQMHNMVPRPL